jgi:dihydrofolate reductase
MKVTVNNSITLDGFICGPNDYEDWISEADEKYFAEACAEADIIIMGSTTYDSNEGLYPVPGKENVVFTQSASTRESNPAVTHLDSDPVSFVKAHNEKNILVAGGGKLNATLLKAGVVTDVIVCVHPIILGSGVRQFEGIDFGAKTNLEKISETDIGDGVVQIHYRVV